MKVCTDACIFGAWSAGKITMGEIDDASILDIGAGTGLLSLMLAQKSATKIDAIEIEENAFNQAINNFKQSPWNERLHAHHADAKDFASSEKYSFIISNPPYYENDLLSPVENKNIAKHNKGLNISELISIIKKLLNSSGNFAVLLPFQRINYFERLANKNHFYLKEQLLVKQSPEHKYFRGILLFTQTNITPVKKELIIRRADGNYTEEFMRLMRDYYLKL
jgi:tRNA1Val (adenine37-N6)-methyltransferase